MRTPQTHAPDVQRILNEMRSFATRHRQRAAVIAHYGRRLGPVKGRVQNMRVQNGRQWENARHMGYCFGARVVSNITGR